MHHAQVDVAWRIGVRLSEYTEKIIPYLTQLKKLFYWIFFRHNKSIYKETQRPRNKFNF